MKIDHHLLEKYWSGQSTPAEKEAVEQWMAAGIPDEDLPLRTADQSAEQIKTTLWQNISADAGLNPLPQTEKSISWYKILTAAAILFVLSLAGIYVFNYRAGKISEVISYAHVNVPYGEKLQVTLSDGTRIMLNSGSKLTYPKRFEENKRQVFLEGEGFFEVSKDSKRPFFVNTQKTSTKVLGTRFNLFGRKDQTDKLTVQEGKVQFTASGCADTLILTSNMQSTYNGRKMELNQVDSESFNAWTKGDLIFNGDELKEVIPTLERWFNVQITCKNPALLNYRVKAKFNQVSLVSVLNDISFALAIHYTIKDKEVVLYK